MRGVGKEGALGGGVKEWGEEIKLNHGWSER